MLSAPEGLLRIGLLGYGGVGRIPPDPGVQVYGVNARRQDWRAAKTGALRLVDYLGACLADRPSMSAKARRG